jgi:3-oxoacyl-[acyl-carrier protein] reductase
VRRRELLDTVVRHLGQHGVGVSSLRGIAKELGPRGIRVNAVAPGAVNTDDRPRDPDLTAKFEDLTAMGRLAGAGDIAQAVRFLASEAASSITGETLTVSAGYRL